MYTKALVAGWGDMDFNAHMRNTAYLDKSADVRMMYFTEHGFPMSEFMRLQLGPVVMRDEVEYFRECRLLDSIDVTLGIAGLSEDGSRMMLRNEFYREGVLCARVTSTAGWFDLAKRKLTVPPEGLAGLLRGLERSGDYQEFAGSVR
ncbi:thioesterase [Massilia sp. Dwa41.01b]|uniref:thioesterase family protein n=1 Tax=unclassified Massilia TaxID=2609279 RepID=UPI00160292C9|nr:MULTISPECIES: thioesterase family protein [unclassified Massilia]QNA88630.1 thioesterase [Massilia sp. Dwa41.01b]QNA99520.1 thioesterase [Massilia sp. Se16.2.3]